MADKGHTDASRSSLEPARSHLRARQHTLQRPTLVLRAVLSSPRRRRGLGVLHLATAETYLPLQLWTYHHTTAMAHTEVKEEGHGARDGRTAS